MLFKKFNSLVSRNVLEQIMPPTTPSALQESFIHLGSFTEPLPSFMLIFSKLFGSPKSIKMSYSTSNKPTYWFIKEHVVK